MIELLALDVDGTVLRKDRTIAPEDRAAVQRARDAGIQVILCTGRILSGVRRVAEELDIDGELVTGGGSSVTDARTGALVESHPVTELEIDDMLGDMPSDVAPFLLSDETVHHDHRGAPYLGYVGIWSSWLKAHPALHARIDASVLVKISLGPRDPIEYVERTARERSGGALMAFSFESHHPSGRGQHVVLVRRNRTKGDALRSIARRRGLARHQMAAVGDWLNDVPMFGAVGRSFVMGQAPEEVACHATDRLAARDETGGGIAEAVDRILRDRPS